LVVRPLDLLAIPDARIAQLVEGERAVVMQDFLRRVLLAKAVLADVAPQVFVLVAVDVEIPEDRHLLNLALERGRVEREIELAYELLAPGGQFRPGVGRALEAR